MKSPSIDPRTLTMSVKTVRAMNNWLISPLTWNYFQAYIENVDDFKNDLVDNFYNQYITNFTLSVSTYND